MQPDSNAFGIDGLKEVRNRETISDMGFARAVSANPFPFHLGPVNSMPDEDRGTRKRKAQDLQKLPASVTGHPRGRVEISTVKEFMSDLDDQLPAAFDPFAEANADDSGAGAKEYVHVRVQQRNGRKSLTTVQGLNKEFSYNKILKDLKKEFCCNGTVVQDP
ncbi:hypothetical protein BHE74_00013615, partial [Ensete ventricosum]